MVEAPAVHGGLWWRKLGEERHLNTTHPGRMINMIKILLIAATQCIYHVFSLIFGEVGPMNAFLNAQHLLKGCMWQIMSTVTLQILLQLYITMAWINAIMQLNQ